MAIIKNKVLIRGKKSNNNKPSISKNNTYDQEDSDDFLKVKEAAVAYGVSLKPILMQVASKPESKMSSVEKMYAVRSGVSKKDLENLKSKTKLDYEKLAKVLSVTRATLINKKNQQKFNAALSERIISLADIYSYGYEVFEDEERFNRWMFKPNRALNGQAPYELMDNQFGREEIRNIIGRIDYGVYS